MKILIITALTFFSVSAFSNKMLKAFTCHNSHDNRPATVQLSFEAQIYAVNTVVVPPAKFYFQKLDVPDSAS